MKIGDTVYIVTAEEVLPVKILCITSVKGVVTGYGFYPQKSTPTKMHKDYVFADKEEADKVLFISKLKAADTERKMPSEDIKGDRHWIQGYGSRRRPRQ